MEQSPGVKKIDPPLWLCDELLEAIFLLITDPCDRAALSEVNRQWYRVESRTRRRVVVRFSYAIHPWRLAQRFSGLTSVTIKGRPRIYDWGLLGDNWGGAADAWVRVLVACCPSLASIHLRRLEVSDRAIAAIAAAFCGSLEVLKLDRCTGFSTQGLLEVANHCKNLRVFGLDESIVCDNGQQWLRALADSATNLEVLNFSLTGIEVRGLDDLAAIVSKNKRLTSLRLDEVHTSNEAIASTRGILRGAAALQDMLLLYRSIDGGSISEQLELPLTVTSLAGDITMPMDSILAARLVRLDLMLIALDGSQRSLLHETLRACPGLEELKARNSVGDEGLEAIAKHCTKLKRIRIENLEEPNGLVISPRGLTAIAASCPSLQAVAIYVSDVNNAALATFGRCCPQLHDFRIAVLDSPTPLSDLPLDSGITALLRGCRRLRKLALYLKRGGVSDRGLAEMAAHAASLTWLLLGCAGYTDAGFVRLAAGCRSLRKLELRHCPFSEAGIAAGVARMPCLRYLWSQGYQEMDVRDLVALGPAWNIEYMPSGDAAKTQFVAYRSLSGPRLDCPPEVTQLVGCWFGHVL